jgi:hypothetical protein
MADTPKDISGAGATGQQTPRQKKPNNGWTREQEELVAQWSDIAACYRWLHTKTEARYARFNMGISIPVIILSTLTGTVNVGLGSIVGNDEQNQKYANLGVGGVSILAGILSTLGNFFKFAQLTEANKSAALAWGKFQRLAAIELALHPTDRLDSLEFIKMCRNELDRMIEQSPPVPESIIRLFEKQFGSIEQLKKPDICNHIEHTTVYENKTERLKQLAVEATLMLRTKKGMLKELVEGDINEKIRKEVESKLKERDDVALSISQQRVNTIMAAEKFDDSAAH